MADFTTLANGDPVNRASGSNAASFPGFTVLQHVYDGATDPVASGDVCTEFMTIPGGSIVLGVMVEVENIQATVTLDIGDAADPNGFVAAQALAVAGKFNGAGLYLGAAAPKAYLVDTAVQFTIAAAALSTGKFKVGIAIANMV